MSQLEVDKIIPQSGTTLTIGDSGDTIAFGTGTTPQLGGDLDTNGNDINFGDNDKAIFGTGNDLEIYHDGSNSYVFDNGIGTLNIQSNGTQINLQKADGTKMIEAINNGNVVLYSNGAERVRTSGTGIDVTGTVVSDGLTVDGDATLNGTAVNFIFNETDTTDLNSRLRQSGGLFSISTVDDSGGFLKAHLVVNNSTGDISFYEDTGTTPKLFWDASAESLGIGTSSPATALDVQGGNITQGTTGSNAGRLLIDNTTDTIQRIKVNRGGSTGQLAFHTGADTERMRISSSGNVGIGTTSANQKLTVAGNIEIYRDDADGYIWFHDFGTRSWALGHDVTNGAFVINSNSDLTANNRFAIATNGNVGIGTSSPSTALDVNGTVKATAFQGDGSALTGISGGGKIGQVVTSNLTTHNSITTSGWTDTGITATITPSSASSKILILWKVFFSNASGDGFSGKLVRASTDIGTGTGTGTQGTMTFATANANSYWSFDNSGNYLDSPSTTSATTYKIQVKPQAGTLTMYINRSARANSTDPTGISTITLMEVLA
jgi:hypothetical protein